MYPFYYPSSSYTPSYPSSSSDAEYLRALAEERAAREQYAAARRAQEEARQRAARARAARRAYASPYSSFHDDDYNDLDLDMDLNDGGYYPQQRPLSYAGQSYGFPSTPQFSTSPQFTSSPYGFNPRQQRALMEEQRRRELLEEQRHQELLELERERRRQEEERLRRILQEERQREEAERRRILEEERTRRALEEEKLRRAIEEEKLRRAMLEDEAARRQRERTPLGSQQASLEPLLRALGLMPAELDSDSGRERPTRDARTGRGVRAHTTSPNPRRASNAPRSPIRPTKSDQPATTPTSGFPDAFRPKVPSPTPVTTIPITSPKPSPKSAPQHAQAEEKHDAPRTNLSSLDNPTPEQVSAAEKIQDTYRTYSARKHALKSIATLRTRFLTAKSAFALPTTLDYETPSATNERAYTTVTVDRAAALPSPALSATDEHDANPFGHVPKLAYTPTNAPLHAYEEELNRILSALDAVESRGDAGVRAARRELARMVEREAERVERWRGVVWNWWTGREKELPSATAQSDVPSASVEQLAEVIEPETTLATAQSESPAEEQSQPAPEESQVQVEPAGQPMDVEPTAEEDSLATPKPAPMEVEPAPAPEVNSATPTQVPTPADEHAPDATTIPIDTPVPEPQPSTAAPPAEPEQPPTPEIDIPDADVEELAPPVDIEVEPPSRAEPAALDEDEDVPTPSPPTLAPEVPIVEEVEEPSSAASEPDGTSTPPLSHDLPSEAEAEAEMEMEVEPQEVHTPPPGAHTPLIVVDPPSAETHAPDRKDVILSAEREQQRAVEGQQPPTAAGVKGNASPLVDRSWDEIRSYDMF